MLKLQVLGTALAVWSFHPAVAPGQPAGEVKLTVQLDKLAWYWEDGDPNSYGTVSQSLNPQPAGFAKGLKRNVIIADVVSIGGKPARGAYVSDGLFLPMGGSDLPRNHAHEFVLDIQTPELAQTGSLFGTFLSSGAAAPGAPRGAGTWAVVGGTGAFVGVRGQGANMGGSNYHITSMREDTMARRANSTGRLLLEFNLSGVAVPEIVSVFHADFTPVTPANPARPGEVVTLQVKASWPTNPPRQPGDVFGSDPVHNVPDFVAASVSDFPADIVNRIGWPTFRDQYRIDVRLPSIAPGEADLRLTGAYVAGAPYKIAVR